MARLIRILATLALTSASISFAANDEKTQPISVEADSLEIRDADNISIYEGNVRLIQGSLDIQSDRLTIHFNAAKDLVLMEMTGNPARFQQRDKNGSEMIGEADRLDYHQPESLLVLTGSARFSKNGDTIESSSIRINTENNRIEAASPEPDQRVRVLIEPRAKQAE